MNDIIDTIGFVIFVILFYLIFSGNLEEILDALITKLNRWAEK